MKCSEAQSLISLERDARLEPSARSSLVEHLAACPECSAFRSRLEAVFQTWKNHNASVPMPDAEQEWLAVRRQIRSGRDSLPVSHRRPLKVTLTWMAVPLAAAAVTVLALFLGQPRTNSPATGMPSQPIVARANSVEVPGGNTSTMVFVDDKSGWLIVWASDAGGKRG